ncbi:MAG: PfkB family carbohydrate kinase [Finegoldia magna]|uniref:1-phosphofructokinase family hexose kinase n=1 Tax=Finegoldia magna TaxID=1260 RepID=UPI00290526AD|nr:PfkB family carbohydrate kinase [Finegoldia magna]MDU1086979.1 PfkB family carbohydrate kinase [Finegoldia magna]
MIYTVTMNPALEFVSEVTDFEFDKNNISDFDLMLPAGKGINVSRILKQLGLPTVATGFAGGFTGEFVEDWLRREDIKSEFIRIDDNTRINIKITGASKTVIESKGPSISHQELQELLYYLSRVKEGDTVFLSTAFPKNITETVVERMIAICKANKAEFVLDIDEYYLERFANEGSLLQNISVKCLEHLFKTKIDSETDLLKWKDEIFDLNSKFVIVPFVDNKVYLFQENSIYAFEIEQMINQKRDFVIDSIIAGFVATFIRTSDHEKSFEMANACALASLKTKDLPKKFQIDDCLEDVNIIKID